jgi:transcriptional regulator with XRE-family HTH domain
MGGTSLPKGLKKGYNVRDMSTVAEQLRHGRESRNLTLQQVAEITKIRSDHIRALEEGNFEGFSAPVYIYGFVRTYASLLKLNVPEVLTALEAELGETQRFSEPPPLSDSPRGVIDILMLQLSKIDWRKGGLAATAIVVVAGVFLGVAVWRHEKNRDPLAGLKPAMYRANQSQSGDTLPLPPANKK